MKKSIEAMRRQKDTIVVRCLGFIVLLLKTAGPEIETASAALLMWMPGRQPRGDYRNEFMKSSCAVRRGGPGFRCQTGQLIVMGRRSIGMGHKAHTAARFILVRGANRHTLFGFKRAL